VKWTFFIITTFLGSFTIDADHHITSS